MKKRAALFGVAALLTGLALAQSAYTFTVNGKPVRLETTEKGGKVYVEATSFARALGASVTLDPKARSLVIVSGTPGALAEVQGTTQLAGGEGALGKTYSLGKTDNALNFTLRSAEYSLAPVTVGTSVYSARAGEKLLVLRYTVQNPQKREVSVSYSAFKITAIDARDVNHVFDNFVAREGGSDIYSSSLKPAQKIDLYLAFAVPAAGQVPKLIVERGDSSPVLRYDLRGKVKGFAAPFADPADASGAGVPAEIAAKPGAVYPMGSLGVRFEGAAYSTDKFEGRAPDSGKRYLVGTFTVRNLLGSTAQPVRYSYSNFKVTLRDAEDGKQSFGGYLIKPSRDEHADGTLNAGEEAKFRVYFLLPGDLAAKSISIAEGESHAYAFDVSGSK